MFNVQEIEFDAEGRITRIAPLNTVTLPTAQDVANFVRGYNDAQDRLQRILEAANAIIDNAENLAQARDQARTIRNQVNKIING